MQLNKSHIGIGAVCLLAGIVLGLWLKGCKPSSHAKPIVIHDTISVPDTAALAAHTKPKYIVKWDTLYLPKESSFVSEDSCSHKDTTPYVAIPITAYEYKDTFVTDTSSIELAVAFSGYNARIDSIGINYQATIQPVVCEKESGWGWSITVGPYVGYGVTINNGRVLAGPEIGLGVQLGIGYQKKFKSLKRR